MIRSIPDYDPTRGTEFSAFVFRRIRQVFILTVANQMYPINIPRDAYINNINVRRSEMEIAQNLGHLPDEKELRENLSPTDHPKVRDHKLPFFISLEEDRGKKGRPLKKEDLLADPNLKPTEQIFEDKELVNTMNEVLSLLPVREQTAVKLYYGIGLEERQRPSVEEIGVTLGISRQQVYNVLKSAMNKLRTPEVKQFLEVYLYR